MNQPTPAKEFLTERPALYVVATPIGNIQEASPRVRGVLEHVDMVACEDTRVTGKLYERLGIKPPKLVSYHDKNESGRAADLVQRIQNDKLSMALVSDAGAPCISDPGYRLVSLAHEHGIRVVPISGPSALISLSMAAGLPTDRLTFLGFLPHKKEARNTEIKSWNEKMGSIVFYETATRIEDTLKIISLVWPQASIAIGRELTKTFEEIVKLSVTQCLEWLDNKKDSHTLKGEFVLMCSGFEVGSTNEDIFDRARSQAMDLFQQGIHQKKIMKQLAHLGIERSKLYDLLLDVKKKIKQESE